MPDILRIHGMIDPHVHLRDLDWSHKATFASETSAALAGGYWAVFDMPNTPPETIDRPSLDLKLRRLTVAAVCDYGVYAGASQADNTGEYAAMAPDCCGLKIFNNATTGDLLIDNQTDRLRHASAWNNGKVIAVHAEGDTVRDLLDVVRQTGRRMHFLHISTRQEIDDLRDAREAGLPISIGVCPHHLFLTENDLSHLGSLGLMKPELKTQSDQDALWAAIRDGLVDVIESDHAPHTLAEKQSSRPPYGVPGLETTLPLMLQAVYEGRLSLERLLPMLTTNPQRIWDVKAPAGTYVETDMAASYTIERANLMTRAGWSPFEGMTVRGRVVETHIRGTRVFDGENTCVRRGFGRNLFGMFDEALPEEADASTQPEVIRSAASNSSQSITTHDDA